MNRKGSTLFIILLSVIYFMFGMIAYQFLKPVIDDSRIGMSCSAPDTGGDMLTCLIIDGVVPIVILSILSVAGGYITDKIK